MADRHTVVVRIQDGHIADVLFCDCCVPLTVEVRTYEPTARDEANRASFGNQGQPSPPSHRQFRDEFGVYRAEYFEPE